MPLRSSASWCALAACSLLAVAAAKPTLSLDNQPVSLEDLQAYRLVGEGACRTPSGGRGTFTRQDVSGSTAAEACKAICSAEPTCLAAELNGAKTTENCEVHTEPIDHEKFGATPGMFCWVKVGEAYRLVGEGACRTPSGGRGTFTRQDVSGSTAEEACKAICSAEPTCLAAELNGAKTTENCEVHTEPIDHEKFGATPGMFCWVKVGDVYVTSGSFMVGTEKGKKVGLLAEMKEKFGGWTPGMPMSDGMELFAGNLDHEKITWLMQREDVKYIESDGVVHAAKKGGKAGDVGAGDMGMGGMEMGMGAMEMGAEL